MRNKLQSRGLHPNLNGLITDLSRMSLNKKGESLCGDTYRICEQGDNHVLVLSDGMGSGVKANILATLTATMLSTMIARNIKPEDAVQAVADTLPVCSVRQMAYATFTVLSIKDQTADLLQFDNPDALLIRDGEVIDYPVETAFWGEKEIHLSRFEIQEDDMLVLMSDGVTNAGVGKTTYEGWGRADLIRCVRKWYRRDMTAQDMTLSILDAGYALNLEETLDDMTVITLKFCRPRVVNLMIGPPKDSVDDEMYLKSFFQRKGKHVICGGTTAKMAAAYLQESLVTIQDSAANDVPSRMQIYGVDLVTEGQLTVEKLLEYCDQYLSDPLALRTIEKQKDAAAMLGQLLLGEATEVHVFFGNAANEAYAGGTVAGHTKLDVVEQLMRHLRQAGKEVVIDFWAV